MSNLKFYVPSCAMCPAMKKVGPVGHEIRYCTGFPGKKQKRLPKNSLKKGVASWCPKQISPPACRVLGFVDEDTAMLEYMLNSEKYAAGQDVAFPSVWHYKQRCTYPLNMGAKQFYEELQYKPILSIFPGLCFTFGEILEIDDGHKPYYFYYAGDGRFIPAPLFDGKQVSK